MHLTDVRYRSPEAAIGAVLEDVLGPDASQARVLNRAGNLDDVPHIITETLRAAGYIIVWPDASRRYPDASCRYSADNW